MSRMPFKWLSTKFISAHHNSSSKQTEKNRIVHVTHVQTHLEVQDVDSSVDDREEGGVEAAGKLSAVCLEYCTMNGDGGVWVERGENHMLEATTNRLRIFRANTGVHVNHFSLRSAIGSHCDTRRNGRLIIINVTRRIVSRVSRTISSDYSPTQQITQRLIPLCFPSRDRQSHHNL